MKNEPAFPHNGKMFDQNGRLADSYCSGITIRMYFAGLAMQGILAGCDLNGLPELPDMQNSDLAKCSLAAADALIAELEKE